MYCSLFTRPPLQDAYAKSGNLYLIDYLIRSGVDVNAKNNNGNTVLYSVVKDDNFQLVQLLITHDADVDAKNNNGDTLLHYAIGSNNLDLICCLTKNGADVNAKNDKGETPLYCALKYDKHKIIPFLISRTKDLDTYDHGIFHYVECTILNESNLLGEYFKLGAGLSDSLCKYDFSICPSFLISRVCHIEDQTPDNHFYLKCS